MEKHFAGALTLEQLVVFGAVVRCGSFSAAARDLGRAQGTVSYQIERLEEQLSATLFDRSQRRPRLTQEGRRIAQRVQAVLGSVDELRREAWSWSVGLESKLHLAVDVLFPANRLADFGRAFFERFPSVPLVVRSGVVGFASTALMEGGVELAIGPQFPEDCETRFLAGVDMVPVAACSHPLCTQDAPVTAEVLDRHIHLVLGAGDEAEPKGPAQGFQSTQRWYLQSSSARHELLRRGLGWSRLPRHEANAEIEAGTLAEFTPAPGVVRRSTVPLFVARRRRATLGLGGQWLWESLAL